MQRAASCSSRRALLRSGLALAGLGLMGGCGLPLLGAQQPTKVSRIGLLASELPPTEAEAFRQGLSDQGYAEGENVVVEYRLTHGSLELTPAFVAELVGLPVDVIVAAGSVETRPAREATGTIPIVMAYGGGDPVSAGFAESLAHPGGNVTGFTDLAGELGPKRLQLLKEAVPAIARVAVLVDPTSPPTATKAGAQALGLQLDRFEVRQTAELESALAAVARSRPDALFVERQAVFRAPGAQIVEFATRGRLPTMFGAPVFVEAGGLMAYGVNYADSFRRAAGYASKILKGARPADLPIERPTKFDFIINLKTARILGLTIPKSILQQATDVIQ